jgi:DNA-binding transcriptional MerR regulator/methylmalonyl-CoA mutase cobalamin-binding subunit
MADAQYPIRTVARLTGLSAHVIRIWEQRYAAVEPARTATNRRLYGQVDIERLILLRQVTQGGHGIGQIAKLPTGHLRRLAAKAAPARDAAQPAQPAQPAKPVAQSTVSFVDECLAAIKALDTPALEGALKRGARELGALGLLQRVIAPLAQSLGDSWRDGVITAAHEHFATAALRVFLGNAARPFGSLAQAPVLVVATPAGQIHELGALIVSAMAADLGWQVTYLGASLPAAEIAGAALQCQAKAVALSLVYPEDDPRLEGELTLLREALPAEIPLLVGGRAVPAHRRFLVRLGAVPIDDLVRLGAVLDGLRKVRKTTARTRSNR